jgi:hypothetical protein
MNELAGMPASQGHNSQEQESNRHQQIKSDKLCVF